MSFTNVNFLTEKLGFTLLSELLGVSSFFTVIGGKESLRPEAYSRGARPAPRSATAAQQSRRLAMGQPGPRGLSRWPPAVLAGDRCP